MAAKRPLKTPADGANDERKKLKAKVRRLWGNQPTDGRVIQLIRFIETRTQRYQKEAGGLGKK